MSKHGEVSLHFALEYYSKDLHRSANNMTASKNNNRIQLDLIAFLAVTFCFPNCG